jgi:hypothetical protein
MLGVVVSTVLTLCVLDVLADRDQTPLGVRPGEAVAQVDTVAPKEFVGALEGVVATVAVATAVALWVLEESAETDQTPVGVRPLEAVCHELAVAELASVTVAAAVAAPEAEPVPVAVAAAVAAPEAELAPVTVAAAVATPEAEPASVAVAAAVEAPEALAATVALSIPVEL